MANIHHTDSFWPSSTTADPIPSFIILMTSRFAAASSSCRGIFSLTLNFLSLTGWNLGTCTVTYLEQLSPCHTPLVLLNWIHVAALKEMGKVLVIASHQLQGNFTRTRLCGLLRTSISPKLLGLPPPPHTKPTVPKVFPLCTVRTGHAEDSAEQVNL